MEFDKTSTRVLGAVHCSGGELGAIRNAFDWWCLCGRSSLVAALSTLRDQFATDTCTSTLPLTLLIRAAAGCRLRKGISVTAWQTLACSGLQSDPSQIYLASNHMQSNRVCNGLQSHFSPNLLFLKGGYRKFLAARTAQ